MTDNWWQQWSNTTNIKTLNVMVGCPSLAPPPKLDILGSGGAQEARTGSRGAEAAQMSPLIFAEVHS